MYDLTTGALSHIESVQNSNGETYYFNMTSNVVKVINFDELINNEDKMNSSSNCLDTPTYSNPLSATNLFVHGFLAIVFTPLAITRLNTY